MIHPTGPDDAPLWLNAIIFMVQYQWYILACMLPSIYIVIVKIIGFPLLQYSTQEVVLMLYPHKVKFGRVNDQFDSYFNFKKGVYYYESALKPLSHEEKVVNKFAKGGSKEVLRKISNPENQIHVFTHTLNQPVYNSTRKDMKMNQLLMGNHKIKPLPLHGVWIMKNIAMHFIRHWQIIIDPKGEFYKLLPAKNPQDFRNGFYHTLGIYQQTEEVISKEEEQETGVGGMRTVALQISNQMVIQKLKYAQEYNNFSANFTYRLMNHLHKVENGYLWQLTGQTNPMIYLVIIAMVGAIAVTFFLSGIGSGHGPGGH